MEQDTIDQLNEATQGLRQPERLAVYHYTALVSKQFHGPVHMDGVITIPVITGSNDYNAVKALIAMECGVDDSFRVQVKSLSLVGETVASCQHETWTDMLADCGK